MKTPSFPLILRTTHGYQFVPGPTILCIEAEDKYARIAFMDGRSQVVLHALSDLEQRLCCGQRIGTFLFLRTHRTCITAMHHAQALEGRRTVKFGNDLNAPLSKRVWPELLRLMGSLCPIEG